MVDQTYFIHHEDIHMGTPLKYLTGPYINKDTLKLDSLTRSMSLLLVVIFVSYKVCLIYVTEYPTQK